MKTRLLGISRLPLLRLEAINARKNKALQLAQVGLSEPQFRAFRGLFLDEFGRNELESELARIVTGYGGYAD